MNTTTTNTEVEAGYIERADGQLLPDETGLDPLAVAVAKIIQPHAWVAVHPTLMKSFKRWAEEARERDLEKAERIIEQVKTHVQACTAEQEHEHV